MAGLHENFPAVDRWSISVFSRNFTSIPKIPSFVLTIIKNNIDSVNINKIILAIMYQTILVYYHYYC